MKTFNKYFVFAFLLYPLWAWLLMAYLNVRIDYLFGAISICFAFFTFINKLSKNRPIVFPKYLVFLFLFYLYSLFINTASESIEVSHRGPLDFILLNEHFTPIFLLFIVENLDIDIHLFKYVKPIALLIFIASLVVIVIQYYVPFFWMYMTFVTQTDYLDFTKRLFSIYSWVSTNAVGISFPFIVAYLYKNYNNSLIKFSIAIGALLYAFFTQTRYVIISMVIILSFLYLKEHKLKLKRVIYLLIIPVIFYSILSLFSYDLIEFFNRRILEDEHADFATSSAGSRITSLNAFVEIFPENPFFGNGEKVTPTLRKLIGPDDPFIHIGFLHYLYAFGIFGCFFFFAFCYLFLKRILYQSRVTNDYSCFIALIVFFLANTTLVWFRFFDFGLFICYLSLVTKYKPIAELKNNLVNKEQNSSLYSQYRDNRLISPLERKFSN